MTDRPGFIRFECGLCGEAQPSEQSAIKHIENCFRKRATVDMELQQRLNEAERVIAFYANPNNWIVGYEDKLVKGKNTIRLSDIESFGNSDGQGNNWLETIGGKQARAYESRFQM